MGPASSSGEPTKSPCEIQPGRLDLDRDRFTKVPKKGQNRPPCVIEVNAPFRARPKMARETAESAENATPEVRMQTGVQ